MYISGGLFLAVLVYMAFHERESGYVVLGLMFIATCIVAILFHSAVS